MTTPLADNYARKAPVSITDYLALVGTELGASDWVVVDQARIDTFADATGDRQFIHVDPERAAATPFGGTVAHGFLTLSLLGGAAPQVLPAVDGAAMGLNYGLGRVRFLAPVRSGSRLRVRFRLLKVKERPAGLLSTLEASVEVEGVGRPALVAEWLSLLVLPAAAAGAHGTASDA